MHNSAFYSHCYKLIHMEFIMYIVSCNSVQNGLVHFRLSVYIPGCNVMYTRTRLSKTVPMRYFCCGSLLLLVLAVRIYTLVHLLCE